MSSYVSGQLRIFFQATGEDATQFMTLDIFNLVDVNLHILKLLFPWLLTKETGAAGIPETGD